MVRRIRPRGSGSGGGVSSFYSPMQLVADDELFGASKGGDVFSQLGHHQGHDAVDRGSNHKVGGVIFDRWLKVHDHELVRFARPVTGGGHLHRRAEADC